MRTNPQDAEIGSLLHEARSGSREALGLLFDRSRNYLLKAANEDLDPVLAAKVSPSDIVQETFLEAQRDLGQFGGASEAEWLAWLHKLMQNNLVSATRSYRNTAKRQVSREYTGSDPAAVLALVPDSDASPAAPLREREEKQRISTALQQLPEHYREVIQWRNYDRLGFQEIGKKLGKSAEAARKLWSRAVEQLQQLLTPLDSSM